MYTIHLVDGPLAGTMIQSPKKCDLLHLSFSSDNVHGSKCYEYEVGEIIGDPNKLIGTSGYGNEPDASDTVVILMPD